MATFGAKENGRQVTIKNKKFVYNSTKGVWEKVGSASVNNNIATLDVSGTATVGSLVGDVTGNVTGDLSGDVTSTGTSTFANVDINGNTTADGDIVPNANATFDLGSTSARWQNIYTSDLSLSNGIGDWTIVEGEEDLFLYNNKNEKVYKFVLAEVDPSEATPKINELGKK